MEAKNIRWESVLKSKRDKKKIENFNGLKWLENKVKKIKSKKV